MNSSSKKPNSFELGYTGKHHNTRKILKNTIGSDANIKMNENYICTAYVGKFFLMFPRTILLYNNEFRMGNKSFDLTFSKFCDSRGEIIIPSGLKFRFVPLDLYNQIKKYVNRVHICDFVTSNRKLIMYSATL